MRTGGKLWKRFGFAAVLAGIIVSTAAAQRAPGTVRPYAVDSASVTTVQQGPTGLTPRQLGIEKQRTRLSSADVEERRDAVTRLGSMHYPEASRLAASALRDPSAIVRATAAAAVLSLPVTESVSSLTPLLTDKDEFVRREGAYALGTTRSLTAVPALVESLLNDKKDEVRGAAAVALGQIRAPGAVTSLASILSPQYGSGSPKKNKSKKPQDVFLLRSAARALGQIGNAAGLPALIAVLQDEKADDDVRRESASALGLIGDSAALPALRAALTARDPYLSEAADKAIRNILRSANRAVTEGRVAQKSESAGHSQVVGAFRLFWLTAF